MLTPLVLGLLATPGQAKSWFPDQEKVTASGWAHVAAGLYRVEVMGVRAGREGGGSVSWRPDVVGEAPPFPKRTAPPKFGEVQVWCRVEYPAAMEGSLPRAYVVGRESARPGRSQLQPVPDVAGRAVDLVTAIPFKGTPIGTLVVEVPIGMRCVARYEYAARRWTQNLTGTRLTAPPTVVRRRGSTQLVYQVRLATRHGVEQPIGILDMRDGRTITASVSDNWTPARTSVTHVYFFPALDRSRVRAFEMKAAETVAVSFPNLPLAPPR